MSDGKIRKAIEQRLAALTPAIDTAWENYPFTPEIDVPYQRVSLLRAAPETPEQTGTFRQYLGVLQVTLFYPQGPGPAAAEARADLLAAHFPKGTSMTHDGVTVTIDGAAHIMGGFQDEDRWAIPVRVPYFSNVSS